MSTVTVTPRWFGESRPPLLGWFHQPQDAMVRAGVVICPPLGKEYLTTHRAVRRLADRIAARGFLVLRFDYPGTGDSARDDEAAHDLDAWLAGVREAQDELCRLGVPEVAVVGLRIGATIAASALRPQTRRLVLWDPVGTGREYLREQAALHRVSVGADLGGLPSSVSDGGRPVVGPGTVFSEATASALRALTLAPVVDFASGAEAGDERVLLLVRSGQVARSVQPLVGQVGIRTEPVHGQRELLDVASYDSVVPVSTLDLIGQFLADHTPDLRCRVDVVPVPEAVVGRSATGDVVERVHRLGPHGLVAITTQSADASGPWAVLLNVATDHHVGPGALWVAVAREAARLGGRAIRFDRRGVGESTPTDEASGGDVDVPLTYTAESVDDVADVLAALGRAQGQPTPAPSVLIGLCSGAWAAAVAARRTRSVAVVLINPLLWLSRPQPIGPARLRQGDEAAGGAALAIRGGRSRPWRSRVKSWLPYAVWRLLGVWGLVHVPETLLRPLVRGGTQVHLLLGVSERPLFDSQRGPESAERLRRTGRLHVLDVVEADHSLQSGDGRAAVQRALLAIIQDTRARSIR